MRSSELLTSGRELVRAPCGPVAPAPPPIRRGDQNILCDFVVSAFAPSVYCIHSTRCGTRARNLRIRGPTPCPLGQGGLMCASRSPRTIYSVAHTLAERAMGNVRCLPVCRVALAGGNAPAGSSGHSMSTEGGWCDLQSYFDPCSRASPCATARQGNLHVLVNHRPR